jgi:hypothetical protein
VIAPIEGAIWADYWAAREARALPANCMFDKAITVLQDLRTREGPQQDARELELFDAVLAVLAGLALRQRS